VTPDPPVREDGLCACGCGKTRPIVAADKKLQQRLRRYAGDQPTSDPDPPAEQGASLTESTPEERVSHFRGQLTELPGETFEDIFGGAA